MFNSSKIYHKRPKRRPGRRAATKKAKTFMDSLKRLSNKHRANPPKSEVWFQSLYTPYRHGEDLYNQILGHFIPDVHNPLLKYVIEIDGSYHDTPKQQAKDLRKDKLLEQMGYKVFRIKAYDQTSFDLVVQSVLQLRHGFQGLD